MSAAHEHPLDGVRVVSLAVNVPGPVAVDRLRALGARVTTVLPPIGDPLQSYATEWFDELHAGQEIVTLDLKADIDRAALDERLSPADVLVTSHRPSALARLGLAWEALHARHPTVCHVAIVGHAGDAAEVAGHDLTYQALSGLIRAPEMPVTLMADLVGAERAVTETLAALALRDRTGAGVRREVALANTVTTLARPIETGLTARGGLLGGGLPGYAVYASSDGHVAFAALEPHFLAKACQLLDVEPTREAFADVFAGRTTRAWAAWASEHDVPLAPVC